jgi:hypothetical protein
VRYRLEGRIGSWSIYIQRLFANWRRLPVSCQALPIAHLRNPRS